MDIGRRIISREGFRYPETNQDVFRVLAEEAVVSNDLLPTLLDMAGFRNLIVHDYARIDDASVYGILRKRLSDFNAFAQAVGLYLEGWARATHLGFRKFPPAGPVTRSRDPAILHSGL